MPLFSSPLKIAKFGVVFGVLLLTALFFRLPVAQADDHGNNCASATVVGINSSTAGEISPATDDDYFEVEVTQSGTLTAYSTSGFDTYGYFYDSNCNLLTSDDDSGGSRQFSFAYSVSAGTYYIAVGSFNNGSTGNYTVNISFTAAPPTNGGWSAWSWGACSRVCATGSQTGSRTCNNPSPANGGTECQREDSSYTSPDNRTESKTQNCNTQSCPAAPNVNFSADVISGNPTLEVFFSGTTSAGPVASWAWDFGNGRTGTGQTPRGFYESGGFFTVSLTGTGQPGSADPSGTAATDTETTLYYITVAPSVSTPASTVDIGLDITFSWTAAANATYYQIYYWRDGVAAGWDLIGNVASYTFGTASLRDRLEFQVQACRSEPVVCTPSSNKNTVLVRPSAPGNFRRSPNTNPVVQGTSVGFTWNSVSTADYYEVAWQRDNGDWGGWNNVGAATSASYDTTAVNFKITGKAHGCNGFRCSSDSGTAFVEVYPLAPANLRVTSALTSADGTGIVRGESANFAWDASSGASRYEIKYKRGNSWDGTWTNLNNVTTASFNTTGYTDAQLGARVRACNVSGCSDGSSDVFVKVALPPPAVSVSASVVNKGTSVTFSWDAISGADRYEVRPEGGNPAPLVEHWAPRLTTNSDWNNFGTGRSITLDTSFTFGSITLKVRAWDEDTAYSTEGTATVTVSLPSPSGMTITRELDGTVVSSPIERGEFVVFSWNAVALATRYEVFYERDDARDLAQVPSLSVWYDVGDRLRNRFLTGALPGSGENGFETSTGYIVNQLRIKVRACDANACGSESIWYAVRVYPTEPQNFNSSPVGEYGRVARGRQINFTWDAIDGTRNYELQISKDSPPAGPETWTRVATPATASAPYATDSVDHKLVAQVLACNTVQCGNPSRSIIIWVKLPMPDIFVSSSIISFPIESVPAIGSIKRGRNVYFAWNAVSGTGYYQIIFRGNNWGPPEPSANFGNWIYLDPLGMNMAAPQRAFSTGLIATTVSGKVMACRNASAWLGPVCDYGVDPPSCAPGDDIECSAESNLEEALVRDAKPSELTLTALPTDQTGINGVLDGLAEDVTGTDYQTGLSATRDVSLAMAMQYAKVPLKPSFNGYAVRLTSGLTNGALMVNGDDTIVEIVDREGVRMPSVPLSTAPVPIMVGGKRVMIVRDLYFEAPASEERYVKFRNLVNGADAAFTYTFKCYRNSPRYEGPYLDDDCNP